MRTEKPITKENVCTCYMTSQTMGCAYNSLGTWYTCVSENVSVQSIDVLHYQHFSSVCKSSDKTGIPNVHDTHRQIHTHSFIQYRIETIAI